MKVRVISSLVGLVILLIVLALFDTLLLNLMIALIAFLAVYELLSATGCLKHRGLAVLSLLVSAAVPFLVSVPGWLLLACYLYLAVLFLLLLRFHEKLHIEQVAMGLLFTLLVSFSLSTVVVLRDRLGTGLGVFYTMVALGSAWLSDTGAYFSGRLFGKHKLAPYVSPKKTVEGAIGGVVVSELLMLAIAWLCAAAARTFWVPIQVHYHRLLLVVPILSVMSMVGDLSASVIKRQYGVKDYGSIIPGHGGIMDRFDSALMVAPLVFLLSLWFPLAVQL